MTSSNLAGSAFALKGEQNPTTEPCGAWTPRLRYSSYLAALFLAWTASVAAVAEPAEELIDCHADEFDDKACKGLNGIPFGLVCRNVAIDLSTFGAVWYAGPGDDSA